MSLSPQKNTRPVADNSGEDTFLSMFQDTLAELLDVEHQLEGIDYQKKNFIHADLSMEELFAEGKRRGETPFTLIAGITLDILRLNNSLEQQNAKEKEAKQSESIEDVIALLSDPMRLRSEFSTAMVKEANGPTGGLAAFMSLSPYIIDARNKAAMVELEKAIKDGKKKIAIFYGAAHLPDFEQRLIKNHNMHRVHTKWLTAWDIKREIPKRNPLLLAMKLLKSYEQPQKK